MRRRNFFRSLLGAPAVAVAQTSLGSAGAGMTPTYSFPEDQGVTFKLYDRNWQCTCGQLLLLQRLDDGREVMVCYGALPDGKPCPRNGRVYLVPQLEALAREIDPAQRVMHDYGIGSGVCRYDLRTGKALD